MKNIKRLALTACAVLLACLLCVCAVAEVVPDPTEPVESAVPEVVATEEPVAEEPSQEPSEEPVVIEEPVVEQPVVTEEPAAEEPFSKGYVLAEEGVVLYADAALTEKAGELAEDAVLYADGREDDVLTVFYAAQAEQATAYVKADKVDELTEAEQILHLDWCKKNIDKTFSVGNVDVYLTEAAFVAEAPVVEEPVVEEPVVEEPVVEEPVEELPAEELIEDLPAEELIEDLPAEELIENGAEEPVEGALTFDAEALTYTSESGDLIAYIDAEGNLIDALTGDVLAKVDLELGVIYIPETEIPQE